MKASVTEQVGWARGSTLVVSAPERCVLEVTGGDRLSWLNGLLTCELLSRRDGDAIHGLAVAQKGKIVSDVVVLVGAARALLVVQSTAVDALVASFEHHLMMEDAELRRLEGQAVWFAHGPRAGELLAALRGAGADGGLLDVTGAGGAVLVTTDDDAARGAIHVAAAAAGGGVGDHDGWEAVRVLSGVPRFGVDFDGATYPQEAALEGSAVSFSKGCYLGQEVVCMLQLRGHVKRRLVSLVIEAPEPPSPHAAVDDGSGASVGEVTSATRSADGEARAIAMVKHAFIAKGTALRVGGHPARVV